VKHGYPSFVASLLLILLLTQNLGVSSPAKGGPSNQISSTLTWKDALSQDLWMRANNLSLNYSLIDDEQAAQRISAYATNVLSGPPPPTIFSDNYRVSGNHSYAPLENEPSIVVSNSSGASKLVVGANSLIQPRMVSYASSDQGAHWSGPSYLPLSRSNDTSSSDPSLATDRAGRIYYSYISLGANTTSQLMGDDLVVATSTDGVRWTPHTALSRRSFPIHQGAATLMSELYDKDFIAVGPSQSNKSLDSIFVTYTDFIDYCSGFICATNITIMFIRSVDGAASFSKPVRISPTFRFTEESRSEVVQGSDPVVGRDGTVYVAYYDSGKDGWLNGSAFIMFAKSNDGMNFSRPAMAAKIPWEMSFKSPFNIFRWWSSMFPSMDIAPDGTLYVAYSAKQDRYTLDQADVFLVSSKDGGITWSPPFKVNDDGTNAAQFFPALRVSSDGVVHIIWGDQRFDPLGIGYDVFYATFDGSRISANLRVTDTSTDSIYTVGFVGDYFGLAVSGGQVYAVWTDGRRALQPVGRFILRGNTDIFIARVGERSTASLSVQSSLVAGYQYQLNLRGTGLPRDSFLQVRVNGSVLRSLTTGLGIFFTDHSGALSDIASIPANAVGAYSLSANEWVSGARLSNSQLLLTDTRGLLVDVGGPSIAFPGDALNWSIHVVPPSGRFDGLSILLTSLRYPDGTTIDLTPTLTNRGSGLFTLSSILPSSAPVGSYTLTVIATQNAGLVVAQGTGIGTVAVNQDLLKLTSQVDRLNDSINRDNLIIAGISSLSAILLVALLYLAIRRRLFF